MYSSYNHYTYIHYYSLLQSYYYIDGTWNNEGQQELSAFLMALEDIRTQGILTNYEFKFCTDQAFGIMDSSIAVGKYNN